MTPTFSSEPAGSSLHQQIPNQLDEIFPCRGGLGEGRVLIEIVMIEARHDRLSHHPIELLGAVRRPTPSHSLTVTSTT